MRISTPTIFRVVLFSFFACAARAEPSRQLSYFGEHLLLDPHSAAAATIQREFPNRLERLTPADAGVRLGNVSIQVPRLIVSARASGSPAPSRAEVSPVLSSSGAPSEIDGRAATDQRTADAGSSACIRRTPESLVVCIEDGQLQEAAKAAAIAFLKDPAIVLVSGVSARTSVDELLAIHPELQASTEIRGLDPTICVGECSSRIQFLRR